MPEPQKDESIEITPVEPIIMEAEYNEPDYDKINGDVPEEPEQLEEEIPESEYTEPLYELPDASEPDESVVITPNQTFYDPVPEETVEKPEIEDSPTLEEETTEPVEPQIEEIPEIELPSLEPDEPAAIPEEIEPDIVEESPPEPVIEPKPVKSRGRGRIRKPVIDESDPDLKIDLGTNTCPHCGSKVPDTIYCIYCGKALNPNNVVEEKEEEN